MEDIIYPDDISGVLGRVLEEAEMSPELAMDVEELYQRAVNLL